MHHDANTCQSSCTLYACHIAGVDAGLRRRDGTRRLCARVGQPFDARRLSRTQAAEALGVSRSTFDRRILPLIETVEMPWGTKLIPVDELQRLLAEQRHPARTREQPRARPGRRATIAPSIVARIRAEQAAGRSLGQIARGLNNDQIPTAHGGAHWWPSTVRAVLRRSAD